MMITVSEKELIVVAQNLNKAGGLLARIHHDLLIACEGKGKVFPQDLGPAIEEIRGWLYTAFAQLPSAVKNIKEPVPQ